MSAFTFISKDQIYLLYWRDVTVNLVLAHCWCLGSSIRRLPWKTHLKGMSFPIIDIQWSFYRLIASFHFQECLWISLVVILIITFLHNFAFNAGTFYLALFYQVRLLGCMLLIFVLPTTWIGSYWIITPGIWDQNSTLLPWVISGIYAGGLVRWVLATTDSWHQWPKLDDLNWVTCLHVGFR